MTRGHMTQLALEPRVNALKLWPSEGAHYVGLTFWCSILTGIGKEEMERTVNYFRKNIIIRFSILTHCCIAEMAQFCLAI